MSLVSEIPVWLQKALEKPVAVFGGGVSGRAAMELVEKVGGTAVLYDEKSEDGRRFDLEEGRSVGLVLLSPGFPVEHSWVKLANEAECDILGEVDFAAMFWGGAIVAITGTNGKTTLTEFLTHSLVSAGIEAYSVGNIGMPFSARVVNGSNTESVAVCELSSFQTETLKHFSPDIVLWTNFDEDHLDRHQTMKAYFAAKYQLVKCGAERGVFYDTSVAESAREFGYELDPACLVGELDSEQREQLSESVLGDDVGNRCFAMANALWKAWDMDGAALLEAANDFRKSPHRMEKVAVVEGVTYWNDSKATNFHAALGGLSNFASPVHWIGGGKSKGGDIAGFAKKVLPRTKAIYLIGETKNELQSVFLEHGLEAPVFEGLQSALLAAKANVQVGDQVVFSPGFASFDLFDSYVKRGEFFKKAVADLAFRNSLERES